MSNSTSAPNTRLRPLLIAWAALVALTLLSTGLGQFRGSGNGLTIVVAAIIWLKAWLVAYTFLEASICHTFIRRLVFIFIAYAPVLLVLTDWYGSWFASWTSL